MWGGGLSKQNAATETSISVPCTDKVVSHPLGVEEGKPELEVFESVKAFLDIDGFIFILGLSREALDKLITKKFEQMGLAGVTGEQYIRKVIQIEINIQEWKASAIKTLITMLANRLDYDDLKQQENIDLIAKGVERNPDKSNAL